MVGTHRCLPGRRVVFEDQDERRLHRDIIGGGIHFHDFAAVGPARCLVCFGHGWHWSVCAHCQRWKHKLLFLLWILKATLWIFIVLWFAFRIPSQSWGRTIPWDRHTAKVCIIFVELHENVGPNFNIWRQFSLLFSLYYSLRRRSVWLEFDFGCFFVLIMMASMWLWFCCNNNIEQQQGVLYNLKDNFQWDVVCWLTTGQN